MENCHLCLSSYQLPLPTLSSSFPPFACQHSCHACLWHSWDWAGREEGRGTQQCQEASQRSWQAPPGLHPNSRECVTTPEPGQGVPESPGSRLGADTAPSLPASIFRTALSSPHLIPKCLQFRTFLPAQETGLVSGWCLINKWMINLLTYFSPFSFFSGQFGYTEDNTGPSELPLSFSEGKGLGLEHKLWGHLF